MNNTKNKADQAWERFWNSLKCLGVSFVLVTLALSLKDYPAALLVSSTFFAVCFWITVVRAILGFAASAKVKATPEANRWPLAE